MIIEVKYEASDKKIYLNRYKHASNLKHTLLVADLDYRDRGHGIVEDLCGLLDSAIAVFTLGTIHPNLQWIYMMWRLERQHRKNKNV